MTQQLWTEYLHEWAQALLRAPQLLHRIAFRPRTIEEELVEATLKGSLRRALAGYDLLSMGLGWVISSGVFLLTGKAAQVAGPAVVISYLLSGAAASLAAVNYAEFSVEYPVAGAGFTYIMLTFGELPAWIAVSNLLLEYMLGTAAVARGFSLYISRLFNHPDNNFLVNGNVDFMAFGVVLLVTVILSTGVRESAVLITALTVVHMLLLTTIIIASFTQANTSNLSPFLLGGTDNMFGAGALVFFAYVGFDVVATAAEESRRPENIPWALLGSTAIATTTYVLMSLGLVMMVDVSKLQDNAEFSTAGFSTSFKAVGLNGMYYVTCITALNGIITGMLVGLYGMARIVMVAARDWLIPPVLATIYPRTQTPLLAQLLTGCITAVIALVVDYNALSDLVSIGTLLVMCLVANALLFRRYYPGLPRLRYSRWGTVESAEGKSVMPFTVPGARLPLKVRQWLVIGHLLLINGLCIGFVTYYQARTQFLNLGENDTGFHQWQGVLGLGMAWLLVTLSMQLCCPLEYEPPKWHIPWWLMPWLPSTSILFMIFVIGSLQNRSDYTVFACWLVGCLLVYLLFSLPMSYIKHYKLDYVNTEQMNVVELTCRDGKWVPRRSYHSGSAAGTASSRPASNHPDAAKCAKSPDSVSMQPSGISNQRDSSRATAAAGHISQGMSTTPLPPRPPKPLSPSFNLLASRGAKQHQATDQPGGGR